MGQVSIRIVHVQDVLVHIWGGYILNLYKCTLYMEYVTEAFLEGKSFGVS